MTTTTPDPGPATIDFARLSDVDLAGDLALLNEPRNSRHMPPVRHVRRAVGPYLGRGQGRPVGRARVRTLGDPRRRRLRRLGGFQHEPNAADFALVLTPTHWGQGAAVTRAALKIGFTILGLDAVLIALPQTRKKTPTGWCVASGSCPTQTVARVLGGLIVEVGGDAPIRL